MSAPNPVPACVVGKSYYIIRRHIIGLTITVRRLGWMPETIFAATLGEANRLRQELSDAGLIGVNLAEDAV